MSEKPEYNKDIKLMIALSPVAFLKYTIHLVFLFLTQTAPTAKVCLNKILQTAAKKVIENYCLDAIKICLRLL